MRLLCGSRAEVRRLSLYAIAIVSQTLISHPAWLYSIVRSSYSALAQVSGVDLVPVCAILAGILGQEIVKAISQKDEPICNYFCFDGGAGTVRRIG